MYCYYYHYDYYFFFFFFLLLLLLFPVPAAEDVRKPGVDATAREASGRGARDNNTTIKCYLVLLI